MQRADFLTKALSTDTFLFFTENFLTSIRFSLGKGIHTVVAISWFQRKIFSNRQFFGELFSYSKLNVPRRNIYASSSGRWNFSGG